MIALTLPFTSKAIAGACISIMAGTGVYVAATSNGITKTVNDVFAACGLCNVDSKGNKVSWSVKKVVKTNTGVRIIMKFPYGKTFADVTKRADAINTGLGADCAYAKEGSLLYLDVPQAPLPSYISYTDKILELTRGNWNVVIGQSVIGEWVLHDFDSRPHLILAGQTRFGKTEALRVIICTLFQSHSPLELEMVGVDMKPCSLEFRRFNGVWSGGLVSEPVDFLNVLIEVKKDMAERANKLAAANCTNVKQYERTTGNKFKRRFIIVDEYGKSFGSDWEDEIKAEMMQVTAMGAGLGVHVILCTQRPDADVIDGKIRANVGSVLCMPVSTNIQSRVALGHDGAELLPEIPGRAIYQAYGKETLVQVPYVSDVKLSKMLPDNVYNSGNARWKPFQARSVNVGEDYDG